MSQESADFPSWDAVAAELRAYREQQKQTWGELDNALIGRYLAGEVTSAERDRVEASLEEHPELRILTEIVSGVLADCTAEAEPVQPRVLAFTPARLRAKSRFQRYQRQFALAAAACLLLGLGVALEQQQRVEDPNSSLPEGSLIANRKFSAKDSNAFFVADRKEGELVARADELIETNQIDRAARAIFEPASMAGPQTHPAAPMRGRRLNRTVARLAERVLDKMAPNEAAFKKSEPMAMRFVPSVGKPEVSGIAANARSRQS